ncbi:hypothetical protein [Chromobacterium violaceum]|uniref:hypothetical protein n=1 Tax=Chromobacterium violaceum TaxID=536 RepID=UPI001B3291A5|nr:hypothetical protein [Chromobacterium violaceum]MBP4046788.1 hypothetical protein [Chromobacterium violaceum]
MHIRMLAAAAGIGHCGLSAGSGRGRDALMACGALARPAPAGLDVCRRKEGTLIEL